MHVGIRSVPILLRGLIFGNSSDSEVNALIRVAHDFAFTRLKQMKYSKKLHVDAFNHPLDLIAFDCIAELFQRDNDGRFVELIDYFSNEIDIISVSEEEIISHFRKLVFSKLNDGIYTIYHNYDRILSNILRGLKKAIQKHKEINVFERFGKTCIVLRNESENETQLPEISMDKFESLIMEQVTNDMTLEEYLIISINILNEQKYYRKFYNLVEMALVLKKIFAKMRVPFERVDMQFDDIEYNHDILSIIGHSFEKVKKSLTKKFIGTKKIPEDLFKVYLKAIEEVIYDTFVYNNGTSKHYFDYLHDHIITLEYEEYRNNHRSKFEYIAKLAKEYTKEHLKEIL